MKFNPKDIGKNSQPKSKQDQELEKQDDQFEKNL